MKVCDSFTLGVYLRQRKMEREADEDRFGNLECEEDDGKEHGGRVRVVH